MINAAGYNIDDCVQMPTVTHRFRARSVVYALDGTAKEDRLGNSKKILTLPFVLISAEKWESLRNGLTTNIVAVTGDIGGVSISGSYRLSGNDIPTPILVIDKRTNRYICQPFTVTLEEI